jgi:hypothetical protein
MRARKSNFLSVISYQLSVLSVKPKYVFVAPSLRTSVTRLCQAFSGGSNSQPGPVIVGPVWQIKGPLVSAASVPVPGAKWSHVGPHRGKSMVSASQAEPPMNGVEFGARGAPVTSEPYSQVSDTNERTHL